MDDLKVSSGIELRKAVYVIVYFFLASARKLLSENQPAFGPKTRVLFLSEVFPKSFNSRNKNGLVEATPTVNITSFAETARKSVNMIPGSWPIIADFSSVRNA